MANNKFSTRATRRKRRHLRVRNKISGTSERPRLAVFRSLKHMEGQLIDDTRGVTLLGLSTVAPEFRERKAGGEVTKSALSREIGKRLAERAREQGISKVVFDRGGYIYHGRVKAFAEGAREGGLEF